jgi:hypothetical protein
LQWRGLRRRCQRPQSLRARNASDPVNPRIPDMPPPWKNRASKVKLFSDNETLFLQTLVKTSRICQAGARRVFLCPHQRVAALMLHQPPHW